jgi:hypothetical protein
MMEKRAIEKQIRRGKKISGGEYARYRRVNGMTDKLIYQEISEST